MSDSDEKALFLKRLVASNWRNLGVAEEATTYEFATGFNVIFGDNGSGKSNLLEAIHYLGTLRSFRAAKKGDVVRNLSDTSRLSTAIDGGVVPQTFEAQVHRNKARQIKLNGKRPRSLSFWHRAVQMVIFHPGHLALAMGGPDGRRKYLDRILEQTSDVYGSALTAYSKALRSRNHLLKSDKILPSSVAPYDEILALEGEKIIESRRKLIGQLSPEIVSYYQRITGGELKLSVSYAPRVDGDRNDLRKALAAAWKKDCARGFTADGPHGDDLALDLLTEARQSNARHFASQGQHRAIVLSMKVSELNVLGKEIGSVPILLLDDVSSELDRKRNKMLFETLSELGGQVFMTTTHPEFILIDDNRHDYEMIGGQLKERVG